MRRVLRRWMAQARRRACRKRGRHVNGSPAWVRLHGGIRVKGFRSSPVYACRYCGTLALLDSAPDRVLAEAERRGKAVRS